ncbi:hypothetical protein [uncultured Porticoccus sp.]|uniref:hypothetical protein n=1 Tax=uncultured Porticoccus sp. TaxID=1256050 RepID=UPI00263A1908|nr:hypothetical protein [uncultured Porticoccus sp.]
MIFIETSAFTKLLPNYLSDEDYRALQTYLMQKPDAGDIVKGSGGVRVIYYWKKPDHEVWMLTIYSKSERTTIPGHILKQIAEAIDHE